MTAQFVFTSALLLLVPFLGLSSCSKDKPQQDSWQMSQPTVEAPGLAPMRVTAASERTLQGDSVLKFAGDPWVSMTAAATCELNGQTFEHSFGFTYQSQLSLKSFWAPELYEKLSDGALQKSSCSLSFQAVNANGSSQDFELTKIKLNSFASDSFQARANLKTMSLETENLTSSTSLDDALKSLGDKMNDQSQLQMVCAEKSAAITLQGAARTPHVIQTLMAQMSLKGRQTCHFDALEKDPTKPLPTFEMTADFTVQFPKVPLVVAASDAGSQILRARAFTNQPLNIITVTNPSDMPAFIMIPDSISPVHIRLVANIVNRSPSDPEFSSSGLTESVSDTVSAPKLQTSGGARVSAAGGQSIYRLEPQQTITITIQFSEDFYLGRCLADNVEGLNFVGFTYGLEQAFRIRQIETAESTSGDAIGEIPAIASPVQMPSSITFADSQKDYGPHLPNVLFPRAQSRYMRGQTPCFW